jgi:hypothetical protein
MIRKILFTIFCMVIIYVIFIRLLPYLNDKNYDCDLYNKIYYQQISALVERKFIDTRNHNYRKIIYSEKAKVKQDMILEGEFQEIYDFLKVGDSLIKKKKSIYYKVKSNTTGKDTLFKLETDCKDTLVQRSDSGAPSK